jgi:hypothetical protein
MASRLSTLQMGAAILSTLLGAVTAGFDIQLGTIQNSISDTIKRLGLSTSVVQELMEIAKESLSLASQSVQTYQNAISSMSASLNQMMQTEAQGYQTSAEGLA